LNPLVRSQASLAGVYTEKDAQRVAKRSSLPLRHVSKNYSPNKF
jgi:hypothetical protein